MKKLTLIIACLGLMSTATFAQGGAKKSAPVAESKLTVTPVSAPTTVAPKSTTSIPEVPKTAETKSEVIPTTETSKSTEPSSKSSVTITPAPIKAQHAPNRARIKAKAAGPVKTVPKTDAIAK